MSPLFALKGKRIFESEDVLVLCLCTRLLYSFVSSNHPKGWWAYEACRETFEFILCGGRIAETEHQERAWRTPQAGGVDPWQYAALFCLFSLFSCWLDSSDDLRISFSTIKILRCRNRLSFFLTRPWGYSWNGKDDEPTPFTILRNLPLAATLSATISRTVMWGSSIGSQSGGKGALTILALQAWQFHARLKQGSYVRVESMGQVWPNPMSWALREICRGARKSPPILAEHCNAGHQTSMERRKTSFACLGWWKNFHRCVCVELLGDLQENRWCLFCFVRRQACWNMLKHIETYWNMLKHVETCWNVETILTDLCRNPMDITISSSYASKTQCFFHNSVFWNIGMCNLQSVYDRRLPRISETRPFSQCALKEPPQEQHQTPRTSRNIMKPWIQHVVQI